MVRNYKRKTNRQSWSKDSMKKALGLHALENGTSLRAASKDFRYRKQLFEEDLKTKTNMPKTIQKFLVTTK